MPITPLSPAGHAERLFAVSPIRPYGSHFFREEEPTRLPPGPALFDSFDWGAPYRLAAETAAGWLQHSRQAQLIIRHSARRIKQSSSPSSVEEELQRIVAAVNGLRARFHGYEPYLRPELWQVIEQAMAHPAAATFGLLDEERAWQLRAMPSSELGEPSIQLLLGPKGWITCLLKALEAPLSARALDLLRKDIPRLQPYSCYYNSMTTYWPFPVSGMLLNRRL